MISRGFSNNNEKSIANIFYIGYRKAKESIIHFLMLIESQDLNSADYKFTVYLQSIMIVLKCFLFRLLAFLSMRALSSFASSSGQSPVSFKGKTV